jgi:hypothetical protein
MEHDQAIFPFEKRSGAATAAKRESDVVSVAAIRWQSLGFPACLLPVLHRRDGS